MKLLTTLLVLELSLALHAAEEPKFISIPLDQASGSKPLASYKEDDAWSVVPPGPQLYDRVPFDVMSKLQLAGNTDSRDGRLYVARSLGIPVGQRLVRLHLLHAANIPGLDDQPVAELRLRYADGTTQSLFITYTVHVRNYYKDQEGDIVTDPNSKLVWTGRRAAASRSALRLYKTTFTLPTDAVLEDIDAFSLFGKSSLAIFGLTGEIAAGPIKTTPTASVDDSAYRDELVVNVLDRDGRPINGARVRGVALDEAGKSVTLGRMEVSSGEPSIVPVDFPARTHELRLLVAATDFVSAEKVLQAEPGKPFPRAVSMRLENAVRVGGVVLDPEGQPVAKAKVNIYRTTRDAAGPASLFRYEQCTTDKRGRWMAREVPESLEDLRFQVTHEEFRAWSVDFSGEGTGPLTRKGLLFLKAEFRFASNPQVSGTVRDDHGQPLMNADVTFLRTNKSGKDEATHLRTDAQGHFNFLAAESGRARLVVREKSFSPVVELIDLDQPIQPVDFALKTGTPLKLRATEAKTSVQPLTGRLVRSVSFNVLESSNATRGELRGEILWTAPADASSEAVWLHPMQRTPDAPVGLQDKVLIRASAPGFHTAWTWVDPKAGEATVALHPYVPWHVRAIDAQTKAPIESFTTMNYNAANLGSSYGPAVARNGEVIAGFFVEAWLKPRLLTVEAPGYEKFRLTLVPELGATNTYELRRNAAASPP